MRHLNTIIVSNEAMNAAFWYIVDNVAKNKTTASEAIEILKNLEDAMKECRYHIGTDPWDHDPRADKAASIHAG